MMPEGGYQSNGSQDTQEREGRPKSGPETHAHASRGFQQSGKDRDKIGKG